MNIKQLDHMVLTVASIEASCRFYHDILGMEIIQFGAGRKALKFGQQKFNLHQAGNEFKPRAKYPTPGASDFCLISDTPLKLIMSELNQHNIAIEEGPVSRTGATGKLHSIYIRDPDNNLIEIANSV